MKNKGNLIMAIFSILCWITSAVLHIMRWESMVSITALQASIPLIVWLLVYIVGLVWAILSVFGIIKKSENSNT